MNFKKSIILFWLLWWSTALWTDIVGGLSHLGYLQTSWAPDENYPYLVKSLSIYPLPEWAPALLFLIIIAWMFINVLLFVNASMALNKSKSIWLKKANQAFTVSLLFWMAFFIADQLIMNFTLEENHMVQGGVQLLTYLALYILPDESN